MADRLDALTVREDKQGKAFWTRIGVAWPNKNGPGYIVRLDAMPAPVDGQFAIHLREPMMREDRSSGSSRQTGGGATYGGNVASLDDDVPF